MIICLCVDVSGHLCKHAGICLSVCLSLSLLCIYVSMHLCKHVHLGTAAPVWEGLAVAAHKPLNPGQRLVRLERLTSCPGL